MKKIPFHFFKKRKKSLLGSWTLRVTARLLVTKQTNNNVDTYSCLHIYMFSTMIFTKNLYSSRLIIFFINQFRSETNS